jgi:hypothetical protein
MRARRWLLAALLLLAAPARAAEVDLLLVLAVDASGSVSDDRFELQRQGYADAFRNPRLHNAVASGPTQSIAVTMFQWTGPRLQAPAVAWTRIGSAAEAIAFAEHIERAPRMLFGGGTSISGAIDHGMRLLSLSPFTGHRRVIDVSGDGANNRGRPPAEARDDAVGQGVTINGLPILAVELYLDNHIPRGGDRRARRLHGGGGALRGIRSRRAAQAGGRDRRPAAAPGGARAGRGGSAWARQGLVGKRYLGGDEIAAVR